MLSKTDKHVLSWYCAGLANRLNQAVEDAMYQYGLDVQTTSHNPDAFPGMSDERRLLHDQFGQITAKIAEEGLPPFWPLTMWSVRGLLQQAMTPEEDKDGVQP